MQLCTFYVFEKSKCALAIQKYVLSMLVLSGLSCSLYVDQLLFK